MFVSLFVWNLYKFTLLNRSEPNFAHVSPLVWKRPYDMYGPEILDLFDVLDPFFFGGHCRIMGTRWLPARPFSTIPLYP